MRSIQQLLGLLPHRMSRRAFLPASALRFPTHVTPYEVCLDCPDGRMTPRNATASPLDCACRPGGLGRWVDRPTRLLSGIEKDRTPKQDGLEFDSPWKSSGLRGWKIPCLYILEDFMVSAGGMLSM